MCGAQACTGVAFSASCVGCKYIPGQPEAGASEADPELGSVWDRTFLLSKNLPVFLPVKWNNDGRTHLLGCPKDSGMVPRTQPDM